MTKQEKNQQKRMMKYMPEKYYGAAKVAMIAAGAVGPLGVVEGVLDTAALMTIWGTLTWSMAKISGVPMKKSTAMKLAGGVLIGTGGYYAGCKVAAKLFDLIPGAGLIVGAGVSSLANILFTYQFAWVMAHLLELETFSVLNVVRLIPKVVKKMATGGFSLSTIIEILRIYGHKADKTMQPVAA